MTQEKQSLQSQMQQEKSKMEQEKQSLQSEMQQEKSRLEEEARLEEERKILAIEEKYQHVIEEHAEESKKKDAEWAQHVSDREAQLRERDGRLQDKDTELGK